MNRKALFLTVSCCILLTISFYGIVLAQVKVGVKAGDWAEYEQNFKQYDLETWGKIKIEILSIQGNNVVLKQTSTDSDNVQHVNTLEGEVGQDFLECWVIPANLDVGDSYKEEGSFLNDEFLVAIGGKEEREYCGEKRQVVYSSDLQMQDMTSYWDKETGMMVESIRQTDSLYYHIKLIDSNIWSSESQTSDDNIAVYGLGATVLAIVTLGAFFLIRKKLRHN